MDQISYPDPIAPHLLPDDSHGIIHSMPKDQSSGLRPFRRPPLLHIFFCACHIGYATHELRNLYLFFSIFSIFGTAAGCFCIYQVFGLYLSIFFIISILCLFRCFIPYLSLIRISFAWICIASALFSFPSRARLSFLCLLCLFILADR